MSDTTHVCETTILRDYDKVQDLHLRLTNMAEAAIAERELDDGSEPWMQSGFRILLGRCVDVINGAAETPCSIGLSWLTEPKNRTLFEQVISPTDCVSFFEEHLCNCFITDVLVAPSLLELLPADRRDNFVARMLTAWIPNGDAWISTLAATNVSTIVAAEAILLWVRRPELFGEDGIKFMTRFLREGPSPAVLVPACGIFEAHWVLPSVKIQPTLWSVLSDQLLAEALMLCAERVPDAFFQAPAEGDVPVSRKVQLQLEPTIAKRVLERATAYLKSTDGLSADALKWVSHSARCRLANRFRGISIPFLVQLSVDSMYGYAMFSTYARAAAERGDFIDQFLAAHQIMRSVREHGNLTEWQERNIVRLDTMLALMAVRNQAAIGQLSAVDCGVLGICLSNNRYDTAFTDPLAVENGLQLGDRVIFSLPLTGTKVTFYGF
jgi:hypothetical protein